MRADRLLSILLLLQVHGKKTAKELAEELEVSERTIYRDIDALCTAGVPVYSEAGHHGGYALVDDYHTNLTGMSRDELRALFMFGSLAPFADLGLGTELKSALLKLTASLPNSERRDEDEFRQRFLFDSTWWQQGSSLVPHLQVVQEAVWGTFRLRILYQTHQFVEIEQVVSPYGLVAKAGRWYLVCFRNGSLRVHQVEKLVDAQVMNERFERPTGFNLAQFWDKWCSEQEVFLTNFIVSVKVAPHFIPFLPHYFGSQIKDKINQAESPDAEGWLSLALSFESFEAARDQILGFGRGIKVLSPRALQLSVCDYAAQTLDLYQDG